MRSLDYNDLEVFAVVVEEGSIRAAALQLNLSEPSVSRHMRRLEHHLGVPLLERSTRGVVPTSDGRLILPFIARGKEILDEMFAAMNQSSSATRLIVWTDATLAPVVMTFLCRSLGRLQIEMANRVASPDKVRTAILHGAADVAFAVDATCPDSVTSMPFFRDSLTYVVHRDHPLASADRVRMSDLAAHEVAVVELGGSSDQIVAQLLAAGAPPERLRSVTPGSTAAMLSLYSSHVGISMRSSLAPAICEGLLVPLPIDDLPTPEVQVDLMFRRSDTDNPGVHAVQRAVDAAWRSGTLAEVVHPPGC